MRRCLGVILVILAQIFRNQQKFSIFLDIGLQNRLKPRKRGIMTEKKVKTAKKTPLEEEMDSPRRRHPKHPSHKDYNMMTAAEARSLAGRDGQNGRKRSKRLDARAIRQTRPKRDKILKSFRDVMDMDEFSEALRLSKDPKFEMLLAALMNPRLKNCSFGQLCKRCDLTINDLATLWKSFQLSKGLINWMNEMPDLMDDVMVDSRSRMTVCPKCAGEGALHEKINENENPICPICNGEGEIRTIGDKDARNTVFEGVGLKRTGGIQVNQNVLSVTQGLPTLEDDLADMEKVFDAEVVNVLEEGQGETGEDVKPIEADEDRAAGNKEGVEAAVGAEEA